MTSLPKIDPRITLQWQRFDDLSAAALYELLRFRQQIFVVEQGSPYPDLDGLDQSACHLVLRAEGVLSGCLRLLAPAGSAAGAAAPVRIGRVAVGAGWRRHGLGRRLMTDALSFCRERYPGQPIALSAQATLVRFYGTLGFVVISAPYDDFGVAHVDMELSGLVKGREIV